MNSFHFEKEMKVEADRQDPVHPGNSNSSCHNRERWCRGNEMEWSKEKKKKTARERTPEP